MRRLLATSMLFGTALAAAPADAKEGQSLDSVRYTLPAKKVVDDSAFRTHELLEPESSRSPRLTVSTSRTLEDGSVVEYRQGIVAIPSPDYQALFNNMTPVVDWGHKRRPGATVRLVF